MDVAIIDYGMSNLHSVKAACDYVGLKSIITSDENQIMEAKWYAWCRCIWPSYEAPK